jgi:hypothetical protein
VREHFFPVHHSAAWDTDQYQFIPGGLLFLTQDNHGTHITPFYHEGHHRFFHRLFSPGWYMLIIGRKIDGQVLCAKGVPYQLFYALIHIMFTCHRYNTGTAHKGNRTLFKTDDHISLLFAGNLFNNIPDFLFHIL